MHEAPPPPDWRLFQKVLNERWPLRDRRGDGHALGIPDQPLGLAVDARVVWERDGEEIVNGRASRWINAYVYVAFSDPRLHGSGVWLRASDVHRR
jgi:hypothetical protein